MSQSHQRTIPPCSAGLTRDDLSAWRDETLPADEADRIAAHSVDCPACQERVRGFETVAAALRAQRIPGPDERLWWDVRAAILTSKPSTGKSDITYETTLPDQSGVAPMPHPTAGAHSRRRRALGTLAAVAAIALVVVGFGRLFQFGASNRPATETFQLHWKQIAMPAGWGGKLVQGASLSVFPADGSIAWICQAGTRSTPADLRLWRTSDAGASWQSVQAPSIPKAYNCTLALDQLDPNFVILSVTSALSEHQTPQTMSTLNGGAHWESDPFILPMAKFATVNGSTYAIRQDGTDMGRLEVGAVRANQNSWQYIDTPLHTLKLQPTQFWLNPASGSLLVQAIPAQGGGASSLWSASVSGANWQKWDGGPSSGDMAAIPTADGWNICALTKDATSGARQLWCSTKPGVWTMRPGPDISLAGAATPTDCGGCGAFTLLGMANDGAALVAMDDGFGAKGLTTHTGLYRLPAGSSHWQNGGRIPGIVNNQLVTYAPQPDGGILWSMPAQASEGESTGAVYTASYPGPSTQPLATQTQQTPTATGNIDQRTPLAWQPINQPNGFQPKFTSSNVLAVAPSDGQTAYACAQPNSDGTPAQLLGWVTHDAGATWTILALPQLSGWCALVVDEVDPRDVLLGFSQSPPAGGPITPELYYRSADGGANWRHIPSLDGSVIYQFATYRGAVYALRDATPGSIGDFAHVQVSADGMASWRTIDGGFFSSQTSAEQLWLNPYNGALLAANIPASVYGMPISSATSALFVRSSDGGAHWRIIGTPQAPDNSATSILVQPPQPNHPWGICIANNAAGNPALVCGDDSGQSWQPMSLPDTGDPSAIPNCIAYTNDGAILAVMTTTLGNGATAYNVYRLPAGASRWQALGQTPEFSLIYAPASGGDGTLWSVPVNGVATDAQGRIFRVVAP